MIIDDLLDFELHTAENDLLVSQTNTPKRHTMNDPLSDLLQKNQEIVSQFQQLSILHPHREKKSYSKYSNQKDKLSNTSNRDGQLMQKLMDLRSNRSTSRYNSQKKDSVFKTSNYPYPNQLKLTSIKSYKVLEDTQAELQRLFNDDTTILKQRPTVAMNVVSDKKSPSHSNTVTLFERYCNTSKSRNNNTFYNKSSIQQQNSLELIRQKGQNIQQDMNQSEIKRLKDENRILILQKNALQKELDDRLSFLRCQINMQKEDYQQQLEKAKQEINSLKTTVQSYVYIDQQLKETENATKLICEENQKMKEQMKEQNLNLGILVQQNRQIHEKQTNIINQMEELQKYCQIMSKLVLKVDSPEIPNLELLTFNGMLQTHRKDITSFPQHQDDIKTLQHLVSDQIEYIAKSQISLQDVINIVKHTIFVCQQKCMQKLVF